MREVYASSNLSTSSSANLIKSALIASSMWMVLSAPTIGAATTGFRYNQASEISARLIGILNLISDKLAVAIEFTLSDNIIKNSKTLGQNIGTENGASDCAQVITSCLVR